MRNSDRSRNPRGLITVCAVLVSVAALPLLSSARSRSLSVDIANSSNREIRHVYLSHVDADDWSRDQLSNGPIRPGQSVTISNITCDRQQVKVIAEDQDGCFLSKVVDCGDNATWTITNDAPVDCGGGG